MLEAIPVFYPMRASCAFFEEGRRRKTIVGVTTGDGRK